VKIQGDLAKGLLNLFKNPNALKKMMNPAALAPASSAAPQLKNDSIQTEPPSPDRK